MQGMVCQSYRQIERNRKMMCGNDGDKTDLSKDRLNKVTGKQWQVNKATGG